MTRIIDPVQRIGAVMNMINTLLQFVRPSLVILTAIVFVVRESPPLNADETDSGKAPRKLTILAVGAHMDDVETGMGSVLISAVDAGHRVVVLVTVSDYKTWKPTIGREEECKADQLALAKKFGYEKRFLDYAYHHFEANNESKKRIADIYNELRPDIVFTQNIDDHWPDHAATGIATKDAVLFAHGYTDDKAAPRCPRVLAYSAAPNQTIRFEPDFFVDATPVMSRYMELVAGADQCLSGIPATEQIAYEATNLKTKETLRMTHHGWQRYCQCVLWGAQNGGMTYGLALKTLWGPRDGRPLW